MYYKNHKNNEMSRCDRLYLTCEVFGERELLQSMNCAVFEQADVKWSFLTFFLPAVTEYRLLLSLPKS
jgi:hypothetical protein